MTTTPEQAFRASLSRRLLPWSLAISLLPLALVAGLADRRLGEALREGGFRRLAAVATAQADALAELVERRQELAARLATRQEISFGLAAGKLGGTAQQTLDEIAGTVRRSIFVVGRDDKPLFPGGADLAGRAELARLLAKVGRDRGPATSDWEPVAGAPGRRLYAAAPVIAEDLFVGQVVVEIAPRDVEAALAATAVEGGAQSFVLAGTGAAPVIVTSVATPVEAARLAVSPLARRALTSEKGQDLLLDHRGVPLLTVWRQIPGVGTVVTCTDAKDTFAARGVLRASVLVIGAVTLLVALAGARWLFAG